MAVAKKKAGSTQKSAEPAARGTASESGPFKTKKRKAEPARQENILVPPRDVAESVDAFREAQDQADYFAGEAAVHKSKVLEFAQKVYSERLHSGESAGFKVQGIESIAMYVVQDASAGLSEEDVEAFEERWGSDAVRALITKDYSSIRFNEKVLEANYDAVVAALSRLPRDVVESLFRPMAMKAQRGAAEKARMFAKTPKDLADILRHLRLKNYIR